MELRGSIITVRVSLFYNFCIVDHAIKDLLYVDHTLICPNGGYVIMQQKFQGSTFAS